MIGENNEKGIPVSKKSNATLVWDRLSITVSFMAFFVIVYGETVSVRTARMMLGPLVGLGIVSVFYWHITESQGVGDLRLYGLVQFLPMLLIPFMVFGMVPFLVLFPGFLSFLVPML